MTTIRKKLKRGKTKRQKNENYSNNFERDIVIKFLVLLNTVKLYHWKTRSYATHKATDELYSSLNEHIDKFVEVLLGKTGGRVHMGNIISLPVFDYSSVDEFKNKMIEYKSYLVGLNENHTMKTMSNTDLYNIRDEILGILNQFLYLLTFT